MFDTNFVTWPLHDASLESISINLETKSCEMNLNIFMEKGEYAVPCIILWQSVTNIQIPLQDPWGSSVFINVQRKVGDNEYVIEMQSGDEIRIEAGSVKIVEIKI